MKNSIMSFSFFWVNFKSMIHDIISLYKDNRGTNYDKNI